MGNRRKIVVLKRNKLACAVNSAFLNEARRRRRNVVRIQRSAHPARESREGVLHLKQCCVGVVCFLLFLLSLCPFSEAQMIICNQTGTLIGKCFSKGSICCGDKNISNR